MGICERCEKEMVTGGSCVAWQDNAIRFRMEKQGWGIENCPDCGVKSGGYHHAHCDIEECPDCGEQLISCSCDPNKKGKSKTWEIAHCPDCGRQFVRQRLAGI